MNDFNAHIRIELTADRNRTGRLWGYDDNGRTVLDGIPISARAAESIAAQNGNPTCEPVLPYGDPPTGEYKVSGVTATGPGTKFRADLYGAGGAVVLLPIGGEAALADACGRFQILIHGGRPAADGRLRVSSGHFRVFDQDLATLAAFVLGTQNPVQVVCNTTRGWHDCTEVEQGLFYDEPDQVDDQGLAQHHPANAPAVRARQVRQFVAFGEYSPGEPDAADIGKGVTDIDHTQSSESIADQIGSQMVSTARDLGLTSLNTFGGSPVPAAGIEWADPASKFAGGLAGAAELLSNGQTDNAKDAMLETFKEVMPDFAGTAAALQFAPELPAAVVAVGIEAAAAGVTLSAGAILATAVVVTVGVGVAAAMGAKKLTEVIIDTVDKYYKP